MTILDLTVAEQVWAGGQRCGQLWAGGQRVWPAPHPLAAYAGTGAGQMPIITDMLWSGAYAVGDDAGTPVVTGLANFGGTGPYHDLAADGVTTAPRLDQDAMLFRVGDLIRMANEAGLSGVHAIMEVYLVSPGVNETEAIVGHSGASAGVGAEIQYMRNNTQHRLRLQNLSTSQAIYHNFGGTMLGAWRVIELRYKADGSVDFALDGDAHSAVVPFGGDLYVNMLGSTMRNQRIGAMVSVVADPAKSMADPEAAVLAARSYLIGRRT